MSFPLIAKQGSRLVDRQVMRLNSRAKQEHSKIVQHKLPNRVQRSVERCRHKTRRLLEKQSSRRSKIGHRVKDPSVAPGTIQITQKGRRPKGNARYKAVHWSSNRESRYSGKHSAVQHTKRKWAYTQHRSKPSVESTNEEHTNERPYEKPRNSNGKCRQTSGKMTTWGSAKLRSVYDTSQGQCEPRHHK